MSEVKVLQRRICLVKTARTCHGAAWSTLLTNVDYVSPTTPDAKLIKLLHFISCPTCRGHRRFKKEVRVVFSRVNLWHTLVSRYGMSYHVVSITGLWNVFTSSQHITLKACFAKLRRDIESTQPSLTRCHRAPHRTCVPPMPSTLASQRTIGAECSSCLAIWRNMLFDK